MSEERPKTHSIRILATKDAASSVLLDLINGRRIVDPRLESARKSDEGILITSIPEPQFPSGKKILSLLLAEIQPGLTLLRHIHEEHWTEDRQFLDWLFAEITKEFELLDLLDGTRPKELPVTVEETIQLISNPRRVAVVYGRDEQLRQDLFSLLRALGLDPVEFTVAIQETGNAAPYVGDVIDVLFDNVQAVVVLWTGDDVAQLHEELRQADSDSALRRQPRPNVILEAGMALSKMPRRTVLVQVGDVGQISDLTGRHIARLDTPERRNDFAGRLETAGCPVTRVGSDWLSLGTFSPRKSVVSFPTQPEVPLTGVRAVMARLEAQQLQIWGRSLSLLTFFEEMSGVLSRGFDDDFLWQKVAEGLGITHDGTEFPRKNVRDALDWLVIEGLVDCKPFQPERYKDRRPPLTTNWYSLVNQGREFLRALKTP